MFNILLNKNILICKLINLFKGKGLSGGYSNI